MTNQSRESRVQKTVDSSEQSAPPVVVVDCFIDQYSGCFTSGNSTTTHHQETLSHKNAMVDWAIGQGMFERDAERLADKQPLKFDEAIFELLNMKVDRIEQLNNLGGWIVWYVRTRATGRRRWIDDRPGSGNRTGYGGYFNS